ncbi:ABC transporter substrate-binding protein [Proteinivorax hydrogeniformans]|uniref:ABC transporter substrate-binding protein n=1 Tax=Proteinivorax hydrogeniformans TaxID=1826727 RepID=A0AAU8HSR8_9FIRM
MKKLLVITLCIVMVMSLAACGGGEADQGVSEDTIKIGSVGVTSGPLAFIGTPYYEGMTAYFNTINEQGGVNGREIELIVEDDEFDPALAIDGINSLIEDEGVFAIVGQLGTPGVLAAADIVEEHGIPSVYFGSGAVELTTLGENFFPVQPNYVYEGKLKAKYAIDEFDAERIGVIYSNDDVGLEGIQGIKEGLEEMGKEDALVADISFAPGETDLTAQVQQLRDADPDVIIVYTLAAGATPALRQINDFQMVDIPIITTYSNADASFIAAVEPATIQDIIDDIYVMGWLDVDDAGLAPLATAMNEYHPDSIINAYTMAGWVAGEVFVAGLEEAGDDLTWEGYIEAMENIHFTEGMAPEVSYSGGARQGVTHMSLSNIVQDEEGNWIFQQFTDFNEF